MKTVLKTKWEKSHQTLRHSEAATIWETMLDLQWKKNTRENGWWRNELLSVKDNIILLKLLSDTKLFLKIIAITYSIWIHARQPCWINKPTSQHKKSPILRYKKSQHKIAETALFYFRNQIECHIFLSQNHFRVFSSLLTIPLWDKFSWGIKHLT